MSSLFEVYDPYTFYCGLSLNWLVVTLMTLTFSYNYWCLLGTHGLTVSVLLKFLFSEFSLFFSIKILKVVVCVFVFLLWFFIIINLFGLLPYFFSSSSHFVFCLSFSLPLWLGVFFMGWVNMSNQMFAHLIPIGTPFLLISFMVLIETVSQLIRPWSLAIRLMANMISGHLLMSLLGGCGIHFLFLQLGFFCFEFFVCFIQAYVFCALLILYYGEI